MSADRVAVVDDHVLFAEAVVVALAHRGYDAWCVDPLANSPSTAGLAAPPTSDFAASRATQLALLLG